MSKTHGLISIILLTLTQFLALTGAFLVSPLDGVGFLGTFAGSRCADQTTGLYPL